MGRKPPPVPPLTCHYCGLALYNTKDARCAGCGSHHGNQIITPVRPVLPRPPKPRVGVKGVKGVPCKTGNPGS